MKKIIGTLLLMLFAFNIAVAQNTSVSESRESHKTQISVKNKKGKWKLTVEGKVVFTEDDKGIKSLSSDGKIEYKYNKNRLKITPDAEGFPVYVINGTQKAVLDANDQKFVSDCVKMMIDAEINSK